VQVLGKKGMVLGELETWNLKLETFPSHSKVIECQFQEENRKIVLGKRGECPRNRQSKALLRQYSN
jgi:hypothetical protein